MASAPPHLLTLPREIRDQIYTYLHHTVDPVDDDLVVQLGCGGGGDGSVIIRLENAPLLSVLLTHSRLYEEYKSAECFTELSMIIDVNHHLNQDYFHTDNWLNILAHVRHVTVFAEEWGSMAVRYRRVIRQLEANVLELTTVRVIYREQYAMVADADLDEYIQNQVPKDLPEYYFATPKELPGLPRVNGGRGFAVECNPYISAHEHMIYVYSEYVYAKERDTRSHWEPADMLAYWEPRNYPQTLLDSMTEEAAGKMVDRSKKILNWTEWTKSHA